MNSATFSRWQPPHMQVEQWSGWLKEWHNLCNMHLCCTTSIGIWCTRQTLLKDMLPNCTYMTTRSHIQYILFTLNLSLHFVHGLSAESDMHHTCHTHIHYVLYVCTSVCTHTWFTDSFADVCKLYVVSYQLSDWVYLSKLFCWCLWYYTYITAVHPILNILYLLC